MADLRSSGALLVAALWMAGCVPSLQGQEPREPDRTLPASFAGAEGASSAPGLWSDLFTDPELRGLIRAAFEKNQELNIRTQEILIARNEVRSRQGEYLPRVSAAAGVGVEKVGKRTSQGASDEDHSLPENLGDFSFGLRGSWELDAWGKLRNAMKSADFRYLATVEGRQFLRTQLVAEISRSYIELLALDRQLDTLKQYTAILSDALEIIRLEKQAARVTELAVQKFEAEVFQNQSRQYALEQARVEAENRINFLVGRYPQQVSRGARMFLDPLPQLAAGVPSDLLKNRPDLRKAELELEATRMDVKAARAAFYPSLSIDAAAGYRSFNPQHLLGTPESLAYNLAGNLTAPLLNRKAIEAQYQSANARQIQAVFSYEQALLQAFTEVANQLARIENLRRSYERRSQQVQALSKANETAQILFQSARADYMEVLLTRRDSLEASMEVIETRKQQWFALIDLYQALGGGWQDEP
jgi:NodT family efflux transporter outer membrane factor (OMF) lipoprotein